MLFRKRKRSQSLNSLYLRTRKRRSSRSLSFLFSGAFLLFIIGTYAFASELQAPVNFPVDRVVEIQKGTTLMDAAKKLQDLSYVKSSTMLQWLISFKAGEQRVVAGTYYFGEKLSMPEVADRITTGDYGFLPKAVTFPEGFTVEQIADRMSQNFPLFSTSEFVKLALPREGFLFPDTYQFFPNVSPETVIDKMSENFNDRTEEIQTELKKTSSKNLRQIIIMASILEKEAKTSQSRRIISGILWKRIENGMPLQVDAPFQYFLGKNTYELTQNDLKIDSPYNTYLHKGLPIGPICNPGLDSIEAALNPTKTDYWYYFSDKKGNLYYSKTLAEHAAQQKKYLGD